jgi:hypothetical protein
MASQDQKRKAKIILEDLEKTREGGSEDMRKVLERLNFNIFAVNIPVFIDAITELFPGVEKSENERAAAQVFNYLRGKLLSHEKTAWKRLKEHDDFNLSAEKYVEAHTAMLNSGHTFATLTMAYNTIVRDYKGGHVKKGIIKFYEGLVDKNSLETQAGLAGGKSTKDGQFGMQLGHGDIGQASATMRMERAATIAGAKGEVGSESLIGQSIQKFQDKINKVKIKVPNAQTCDIKRAMSFDSKGNLKLSHIHVISNQSARSNSQDAVDERAGVQAVQRDMQGIMSDPGSVTPIEAIESVLFNSAAGKSKSRRKRVTGTRRKSVKSVSKGSAKKTFTDDMDIPVMKTAGIDKSVIPFAARMVNKSRSKKGQTPSRAPLHLIGLMNKELPSKVKENMGRPRLENQTGRFAESVRLTEMINTPQGFPSIGYTYQRDPYGVHEQDSGYDPRKLIDQSIREIAMQFAIGRFYTRRV